MNRNEVAAHGVPDGVPFSPGDIVTVDIVIEYMGWKIDSAWSYGIPPVPGEQQRLINSAWQASLLPLIARMRPDPGRHAAELLQHLLSESGMRACDGLAGHAIGRELHMPPRIPYDPRICSIPSGSPQQPFVFCWEPVLTPGSSSLVQQPDGSFITADGSPTAQFEHMFRCDSRQGIRLLNLQPAQIYAQRDAVLRARPPW